jgi:PAP2 superfamily protein
MSAADSRRWRVLYVALAILLLPFLADNLNFPHSFTGYGIASVFVLHVVARHRPKEWVAAVVVGFIWNQCARLTASMLHLPGKAPMLSLAMLGAGSLIVLGGLMLLTRAVDPTNLKRIYLPSVVLLALVLISQLMLIGTTIRGRATFDAYLQAFDLSLTWPPVFGLGRIFQRLNRSPQIAQITYLLLPMMVAAVCAGYIRFRNSSPWTILKIMAVAGILGYAGYLLFPAVGPAYIPEFTFPTVPFSLGDITPWHPRILLAPAGAARNAMPSLHMAWALLLWFNARALPGAFRILTLIYVLLTIVVVLGLGEHYIADLVVALPFSVLVQAICSPSTISSSTRSKAAIGSGLLVAGWLLALRYGTAFFMLSPIVPWSCAIVSSAASAMLLLPLLKMDIDLHSANLGQAEVPLPGRQQMNGPA